MVGMFLSIGAALLTLMMWRAMTCAGIRPGDYRDEGDRLDKGRDRVGRVSLERGVLCAGAVVAVKPHIWLLKGRWHCDHGGTVTAMGATPLLAYRAWCMIDWER